MNSAGAKLWYRLCLVRDIVSRVMSTEQGQCHPNKKELVETSYQLADEIMKQSGVPDDDY